jgi:prepilin-type N-terminal cleavage/methylation domain-containing protein
MRYNKRHHAGFTLIETIAVLIILAIVSAVAISRVGTDESNLRAELNDLKAALRYAQQMSIASDSTMTFSITVTTTGYAITRTGGTVHPMLPGESGSTHTFSSVSASPAIFNFNEWGGLAAGSASTTTLTKTQGGTGSSTINIIPETGYAYES